MTSLDLAYLSLNLKNQNYSTFQLEAHNICYFNSQCSLKDEIDPPNWTKLKSQNRCKKIECSFTVNGTLVLMLFYRSQVTLRQVSKAHNYSNGQIPAEGAEIYKRDFCNFELLERYVSFLNDLVSVQWCVPCVSQKTWKCVHVMMIQENTPQGDELCQKLVSGNFVLIFNVFQKVYSEKLSIFFWIRAEIFKVSFQCHWYFLTAFLLHQESWHFCGKFVETGAWERNLHSEALLTA